MVQQEQLALMEYQEGPDLRVLMGLLVQWELLEPQVQMVRQDILELRGLPVRQEAQVRLVLMEYQE